MRMLFLDDEEYLHRLALLKHGDEYIIDHARTAEEAMRALAVMAYDVVSLDHDLKPDHYQGKGIESGTGYDVARYIVAMDKHLRPKNVLVHSLSKLGSIRIITVLMDAGIAVAKDDIFSGIQTVGA